MKRILLILSILLNFNIILFATDYYISSSGDDNNNTGLAPGSPWKTIAKVNTITFKAGDRILFNRGDTFYGTLKLTRPGTAVSPIIVGAYGTVAGNPRLTGFINITSWTNEGNGIYSTVLNSVPRLEMVLVDGKQYWMGQYPSIGFLTYESYNDNLSITDNTLSSTPDWTGAEIYIRKNLYTTNRAIITNHTNQTLTYSEIIQGNDEALVNNYGYIIQNDIKTLKDFGDWCFRDSKFYIYFGSEVPGNHNVQVANLDDLIDIVGGNYVTIENLHLLGSNKRCINLLSVRYLNINNCKIEYAGSEGLVLRWYSTSSNITVSNSEFRKINGNAVDVSADRFVFTNNIIDSIGLVRGACYASGNGSGIFGIIDNGLIQYNEIRNTGHHGIYPYGSYFQIINNYIHDVVLEYLDAGAIYITHDGATYPGQVIKNNIIINSVGDNWGTNNYFSYLLLRRRDLPGFL